MDGFLLDIRSAWRAARRRPQLTILTVLTLVLGIGANTAIFAVARGTLLRPLPYTDPDSLVMIWRTATNGTEPRGIATPQMLDEYRKRTRSFGDIAAAELWNNNPSSRLDLLGPDGPERLRGSVATPNFFAVLGVGAVVGRTFVDTDDRQVVVLSDALWRRRFGGNPDIIGTTIELTGGRARQRERFEVIGVLPPRFRFTYPDETEVWLPLPWRDIAAATQQGLRYDLVARLKPDVHLLAANDDLEAVVASLRADFPKGGYDRMRAWAEPVHEWSVGRVRPAVRLIAAVTGLLLVIGALNVASLLLAQTVARRREIALQQTLGASRARLMRQLLSEAAVLTVVSTGTAILAAMTLQQLIRATLPPLMPRIDEVEIDLWTIGWTTAAAAATLALAGLLPGWRGACVDPRAELDRGARTSSGGIAATRIRQGLTVLQIGAVSVLLISGSLLLLSFWNLRNVDLGFDGDAVLTQEMRLMGPAYGDPARQLAFHDQLLQRIRQISGVREASTTTAIPFRGTDLRRQFAVPGTTERLTVNDRRVEAGYFGVMRIPLLEGRLLSPDDTATAPRVAVISESFARAYFPQGGAIGRTLPNLRLVVTDGKPSQVPDPIEIVGIVGDVRTARVEDAAGPAMYVPRAQQGFDVLCLVLRTDPAADHVAAAVRTVIRDLDPQQPVGPMTTVAAVVSAAIADRRFFAVATSAFAVIALLLTAAGLYGVMALGAAERSRELGIRVALGATPRTIVAMLVQQGIAPVAAGILLGGVAASWGMSVIGSYLFGIRQLELDVVAAVAMLVMTGGLAACVFPARVAALVDPVQTLKSE